jgi:hypothetical protein
MSPGCFARAVLLSACAALVFAVEQGALGPVADPARLAGAAVDTCYQCKDIGCNWCPAPIACREVMGYCSATIRSESKWCAPQQDGPFHRCKWHVDPAGSCVTRFLNPCTPENVRCHAQLDSCGPLGICIAEGVCPH